MGREADTLCQRGSAAATPVKALLESRELILRGSLKARWPLEALRAPRVDGDALCFDVPDGETVRLLLGAAEAAKWLAKLRLPPPTLAHKLGLSTAQPAAAFGPVDDDAALAEALNGARTDRLAEATQLIALVRSPAELAQALSVHAGMPQARFVWVVNEKGTASPFGENAIRAAMRALGYRDSKTCAVSATLSATRYGR